MDAGTPSRRTEAGGAHYHVLKATERWKAFRADEQAHAVETAEHRARYDERRQDADLSVRAGRPNG